MWIRSESKVQPMEKDLDNTGTDKDEYYDILSTEECLKDSMHLEKPTEEIIEEMGEDDES